MAFIFITLVLDDAYCILVNVIEDQVTLIVKGFHSLQIVCVDVLEGHVVGVGDIVMRGMPCRIDGG